MGSRDVGACKCEMWETGGRQREKVMGKCDGETDRGNRGMLHGG